MTCSVFRLRRECKFRQLMNGMVESKNRQSKILLKYLTSRYKRLYTSKAGSRVTRLYGVLAQLGEHLPYKQRVIGSSPIGPI